MDSFKPRGVSRAFTLLELLIVVLIIGILSSIAIPRYREARRRAEWAQAWATLGAIYEVARYYHDRTGNDMTFGFRNAGSSLNNEFNTNYSDYYIIDIPSGAYTVGQRDVGYEISGDWIQVGESAGNWAIRKNIVTGATEQSTTNYP